MVQLVKRTDEYKVDTEKEAQDLIDKTKTEQSSEGFELTNFGSAAKNKKLKGEIIDSWFIVKLTKQFNEIGTEV